tara:strand:- start:3272 stop:3706 length:435 start_codon:yes stop_codon:yes gene_type:complete
MTEDHSYFVFKLVSGEEVVAATRIDDTGVEPAFFLIKPLKVELTHKGSNTLVRLLPWITIPDEEMDETYRVGFDKIITMTELEVGHDMIDAYNHYNISRQDKKSHKVKISEKMGYKGDVEKTRDRLEKIFCSDTDTLTGITTTV